MPKGGYQTGYEPIVGDDDVEFTHNVQLSPFSGKNPVRNEKSQVILVHQGEDKPSMYSKIYNKLNGIVLITGLAVISCLWLAHIGNTDNTQNLLNSASAESNVIDSKGRYIMRDYDLQKPMANFLNGIAGKWGVPMWAFYINRGQGITSFGKQNKDSGISKFLTAEKAYQQSPFTGFRTMVKGKRLSKDMYSKDETWNYMPFYPRNVNARLEAYDNLAENHPLVITRNMLIGVNEFEIEEVNTEKALQTNVVYFSMPGEDFPSLVRMTTLTNLDAKRDLEIEALDGLAKLIPSGLHNGDLDSMGRTLEAWMNVYNVGTTSSDDDNEKSDSTSPQPAAAATGLRGGSESLVPSLHRILQSRGYNILQPFYHISQGTADTAQVQIINDGHFVLSYVLPADENENDDTQFDVTTSGGADSTVDKDGMYPLLPFIVDPSVVFKFDTTLTSPTEFYASNITTLLSKKQCTTGRTPCAYSSLEKVTLAPLKNVTIVSIYGHADNLDQFVNVYAPLLRQRGFIARKRQEAAQLVVDMTNKVATNTSNPLLNQYIRQNFLDNLLRGGIPILLGDNTKPEDATNPAAVIEGASGLNGSKDREKAEKEKAREEEEKRKEEEKKRQEEEEKERKKREEAGQKWQRDHRPTLKPSKMPVSAEPVADSTNADTSATSATLSRSAMLNADVAVSSASVPSAAPTRGVSLFSNNTNKPKIFHTFSRIHGDIERDYNNFQIDTTYFSQGPGNFRDVAQNRRGDVFHTPETKDFNVIMFLSFVQADGYNPLTVGGTNFKIPSQEIDGVIRFMELTDASDYQSTFNILSKSFRPGQLFNDIKSAGISYSVSREALLNKVTHVAMQTAAAQYAQNGFWTDHWTYTLDLVDNYLSIYPDKEQELLFHSAPIPFYMSPAYVKSRTARYSLVNNNNKPGTSTVAIYSAVSAWGDVDFSPARMSAMNAIFSDSVNFVADPYGAGNVWQRNADNSVATVNVFGKLLILGVLKFSTLDSQGMGVEMEGGKPGWNDAMNGLPGLLGSGMPETYEMLRIIKYVVHALKEYGDEEGGHLSVPVEFGVFMSALEANLDNYNAAAAGGDADFDLTKAEFSLWDNNNNAREAYRASVIATFSGARTVLKSGPLLAFLKKIEVKVGAGIARAKGLVVSTGDRKSGSGSNSELSPTYFYYECTDYTIQTPTEITVPAQSTQVKVNAFKQHMLPLFLEGPTRHLKVVTDIEDRRAIYQAVKASPIYDEALQMYKLSAPLTGVDQSVGRLMAFSPGWLENQSVWLHMSYKFYLELLRGGLYEEFYAEISTGLVPFMDPKVYGRSPVEAASFIVSSEFPDESLHGSGFLARLSGSTAEFLSMWSLMMVGQVPFTVSESKNELGLSFAPKLPASLFNSDNTLSFTFLGSVLVTYHNPARVNTWNATVSSMTLTDRSGVTTDVQGAYLDKDLSTRVRDLEFTAIDVNF